MIDFHPTSDTDGPRPGCEPAQGALQRLLDGEANWDVPEASAHRTACFICREELILARSITAGFNPTIVPSGLGNRVLTAAIAAHRRRKFMRYSGVAGSLAAAVLVALFAFQPTRQTITERPTVAALPQVNDKAEPVKPLGEAVSVPIVGIRCSSVCIPRSAKYNAEDVPNRNFTVWPHKPAFPWCTAGLLQIRVGRTFRFLDPPGSISIASASVRPPRPPPFFRGKMGAVPI